MAKQAIADRHHLMVTLMVGVMETATETVEIMEEEMETVEEMEMVAETAVIQEVREILLEMEM